MATAALLYDKLLADPMLGPFFQGLDMNQQVRKQVAFLSWAFGAELKYEYRPLGEAHAHLVRERGLSGEHFDRVAGHLAATLRELGIAPELIAETLALVACTRNEVLGAHHGP